MKKIFAQLLFTVHKRGDRKDVQTGGGGGNKLG